MNSNLPLSIPEDLPWLNTDGALKIDEHNILFFWSLNCPACSEVMQQLHEASLRKHRVVGVHVPFSEAERAVELVKKYIDRMRFPFPVILDQYHELAKAYGVQAVPAYSLASTPNRQTYAGLNQLDIFLQTI